MTNRRSNCNVAGVKAEHRFAARMEKMGRTITWATEQENRMAKWDLAVANGVAAPLKFDVKTVKLGGPSGSLLLELKGVSGYAGWLYGESDYIAFEKDLGGFMVFSRSDLADLIETEYLLDEEACRQSFKREKPRYGYAVNNFYGRPNRKDVFIYLDADWVMEKLEFWEV